MGQMETTKRQGAFAPLNATACFPDMEAARTAIEALEEAGVEGSAISLLGPRAEDAADEPDTVQRDDATVREGLKATLGGAIIGMVVGALLGLLAGALAFGLFGRDEVVWGGVLALTIGGAVAGGGVGFTAGAMARIKQSQAWELTLGDVGEGWVVVGLHTDNREMFGRGGAVLQGRSPERYREFDRQGRSLG